VLESSYVLHVRTHCAYIYATCKRRVEKEFTTIGGERLIFSGLTSGHAMSIHVLSIC